LERVRENGRAVRFALLYGRRSGASIVFLRGQDFLSGKFSAFTLAQNFFGENLEKTLDADSPRLL
jgi:hypothetical protein